MRKVWFFAVLLIGGLSSISFGATYGGGSGTSADPYQIWTPQQMNTIGANSGDWSNCFKLMADIDMSIYTGTQYKIIGNSTTKFTGIFDGNNHKISNLSYTTTAGLYYVGLFGYTYNSSIKNLGLMNVFISSVGNNVGALVGRNEGLISNCYATGAVKGGYYVGGLVGSQCANNTISLCYTADSVSGINYVGGLVGWNGGLLSACYATGSASGTEVASRVGGLVGMNYAGLITNCYATGSINSTGEFSSVGGLVGNYDSGSLTKCYATGPVSGRYYVGGLVGEMGILTISACFWDIQTSGINIGVGGPGIDPDGLKGKTTEEMQIRYTFTSWNFTSTWAICEGTNYPRLQWQIPAGDWACPDGVNVEDLGILSACWMETVQARSDINADDAVNLADFMVLAQQWLITGCGLCGGADITGDGNVDELDLTMLAEQWLLLENTGCRMADLNADGKIDLADWAVFAQHWLMLND
jgi:hypothetical protein